MPLNIQDKKKIVEKINIVAKNALSIVIVDPHNIKVNEITKLRKLSREINVYIYIVRNTLMRRIIKDTSFKCLINTFVGPTMIAFSNEHPGSAARLFKNFEKNNINFKIKIAAFEGKIIPASKINYLADIPTHKEAIIRLILVIQEIIIRLISIIQETIIRLILVIKKII